MDILGVLKSGAGGEFSSVVEGLFLDLKNFLGVSSDICILGTSLSGFNSSISLGFLGALFFKTGVLMSGSSSSSLGTRDSIESRFFAKFSGSPTPRDAVPLFFGVP